MLIDSFKPNAVPSYHFVRRLTTNQSKDKYWEAFVMYMVMIKLQQNFSGWNTDGWFTTALLT